MKSCDSSHAENSVDSISRITTHVESAHVLTAISTGKNDLVTQIRESWVGTAYKQLKKIPFVGESARWILPFYISKLHAPFSHEARWRQLVKLTTYVRRLGLPVHKLAGPSITKPPFPRVFPAADKTYLSSSRDQIESPEVFATCIKQAIVYGGTNLILVEEEVICHDLYDFARDYTSEELHLRTLICPRRNRIRWLLHDSTPVRVPRAASFVDALASNYAHWMTEVLPRISAFCADEQFKDVPIIVNDGLHKNIMESLFLFTGAHREIFLLPVGSAIQVDELILTSIAGYLPFERRTNRLSGHSNGNFSLPCFELLNGRIKALLDRLPTKHWPDKIYLSRNSGVRRLLNSEEVEKLVIDHGYTIIETEKLSFLEQVQACRNARHIIAPTGAALVNAIFCSPETRVAVLMGKHKAMIFRYWLNMLAPLKIEVSYVLGNIIKNKSRGMHGDYLINTKDIIDFMEMEK